MGAHPSLHRPPQATLQLATPWLGDRWDLRQAVCLLKTLIAQNDSHNEIDVNAEVAKSKSSKQQERKARQAEKKAEQARKKKEVGLAGV